MANKSEIIKANLAFMFGRNQQNDQQDPDKRSLIRTNGMKYIETSEDKIQDFINEYDYLSPSYPCSVHIPSDSIIYPSYEHALQASKTNDMNIREYLSNIHDIKELKRAVSKYIDITQEWKDQSLHIAEQLLRDKFFCSRDLQIKLLKTEHRSIYYLNNFNDLYWGINKEGKGQNNYGKIIELIRESIEKGTIEKKWIHDHFQLENPENLLIKVISYRPNELNHEEKLSIESNQYENLSVIHFGKSSENDVPLPTPTASRIHALILVDKHKGLILIDLHSANGTFINNSTEKIQPMTPIILESGVTVIQFALSKRRFIVEYNLNAEQYRREQLYLKLSDPKQISGDPESETTVFIGNLSYSTTETDLSNAFTPCGTIRNIKIPKDQATGEGRGIAFIVFETISGLRQALIRDGDLLNGRPMKVKRSEAKSADKRSSNSNQNERKERRAHEKKKDDELSYYQDPRDNERRARDDSRVNRDEPSEQTSRRRRSNSRDSHDSDSQRRRRNRRSASPKHKRSRRSRSRSRS